jgi:hypothetical protein
MVKDKQLRPQWGGFNRRLRVGVAGLALMGWLGADGVAAVEVKPLESVRVATSSVLNPKAVFWYRPPSGGAPTGILLLVPGCNGDGRAMLDEAGSWARFAEEERLVAVGPTFKTTLEEVHSRQGYYYPELWSGSATLKALDEIRARSHVAEARLLVFGFSAGAHFAHRSYLGMAHEGSTKVDQLDVLFLKFYDDATRLSLEARKNSAPLSEACLPIAAAAMPFVGDTQSWKFYKNEGGKAESISDDSRVYLPSEEFATFWGGKGQDEDAGQETGQNGTPY